MVKKILDLVEKYVQWGVLGIGVLFLGFMAYSYLYLNPAAKPMPGQQVPVGPGKVDSLIADGSTAILEQRMRESNNAIEFPVKINVALDLQSPTANFTPTQGMAVWDSWKFDPDQLIKDSKNGPVGNQVAALPVLPPVKYVDQEPLRTVLAMTDANGQVTHKDQDAVTTFWSLSPTDLADAFKTAFGGKIPQQQVIFARVILTRQEHLADGSWGADTVVPGTFGVAPPPYPATGDPQAPALAGPYRGWMIDPANQLAIVAAPFPQVAADNAHPELQWQPMESWIPYRAQRDAAEAMPVIDTPAAPAAPVAPPPPVFNPVSVLPPQFGGGGGFRRGGPGAGGDFAPPRPVVPPPQPVQQPATPAEPTVVAPTVPQLQLFAQGGVNITPPINPMNIELWFHDLTVEPGKTYRYKVVYTLWNPVYGNPQAVSNPKLADIFGIDSQESSWSETVVVPARTKFWCMPSKTHNPDQINTAVFSWHDGQWQYHDYPVAAGDEIGADEGDAGNFLTHWTLLDSSILPRYIILVPDNGGPAEQRSLLADASSQEYKRFMRDYGPQPKAAPGAAAPAAAPQLPPAAAPGAFGTPGPALPPH